MRPVAVGSSIMLASALMLTGLLAAGVAAQDAQEDEMMDDTSVECTYEPRDLDDLKELFGEIAPAGEGEKASLERNDAAMDPAVVVELPENEPADQETTQAVHDAVKELVACFSSGYLFLGVTDEFLTSQIDTMIFDEDFVAQIEADPKALPEDLKTQIIGFGDVLVLEGGRVGVLFHYRGPASPGEGIDGVETDFFILRDVDGKLLIDEVIENLELQYGPAE